MALDYFELRILGTHQGQPWELVQAWQGDNLTVADYYPNALNLVEAWDLEMKSAFLDLCPSTINLLRISARKASAGGGAIVDKQYEFGIENGTVSGAAASNQLCPVINLIPPMGVKSQGRNYLPAIAEADIAGNAPIANWLTRVNAMMTIATSGFTSSPITWKIAIHSRKNSSFALAVDWGVSPIVGWQRRRQRMNM